MKTETALALPMEPLFPRWKRGDLLKLARVWALRETTIAALRAYGIHFPASDGQERTGE